MEVRFLSGWFDVATAQGGQKLAQKAMTWLLYEGCSPISLWCGKWGMLHSAGRELAKMVFVNTGNHKVEWDHRNVWQHFHLQKESQQVPGFL